MTHIQWPTVRWLHLVPGDRSPAACTRMQLHALQLGQLQVFLCGRGAALAARSTLQMLHLHCHICGELRLQTAVAQLTNLCAQPAFYFCDMTTAKRRTNQIREVPAQQPWLVMFSSAYKQAYKQSTSIISHNAELFGNSQFSRASFLVGRLYIQYFLGSPFPQSTQTRKLMTSRARYFVSHPHFLVTLF